MDTRTEPAELAFEYRPKSYVAVGAGALFGVFGAFLWNRAETNDRGLVIEGIFHLGPVGATRFWWGLVATCFAFVLAAVVILVCGVTNPQRLVLGAEGLSAPRWMWSRRPTFVRYDEVLSASSREVSGQAFLTIVHGGGRLSVNASMLESREVFEEFCFQFARRCEAGRAGPAQV